MSNSSPVTEKRNIQRQPPDLFRALPASCLSPPSVSPGPRGAPHAGLQCWSQLCCPLLGHCWWPKSDTWVQSTQTDTQPCLQDTFPRRSFILCNSLFLFSWGLIIKPSQNRVVFSAHLMQSIKGWQRAPSSVGTSVPCTSSELCSFLQQLRTLPGKWEAPCMNLQRVWPYMNSLVHKCRQTFTPAQGSRQGWGQNNSHCEICVCHSQALLLIPASHQKKV